MEESDTTENLRLLKSFLYTNFTIDPNELPKNSEYIKNIKKETINHKLDKFLTLDDSLSTLEPIKEDKRITNNSTPFIVNKVFVYLLFRRRLVGIKLLIRICIVKVRL